MLRLRLACMALACGFLLSLSGCRSTCEEDRLFPRLFQSRYRGGSQAECDCHSANMPQLPPIMDSAALPGPNAKAPRMWNANAPIPITDIPANQAPNLLTVPQARPTPYSPTN